MKDQHLLSTMESLLPSEESIEKALIYMSIQRPNVKNLIEALETLLRARMYNVAVKILSAKGFRTSSREVAKLLFTPKTTVDRFPHISDKEVLRRSRYVQVRQPRKPRQPVKKA